MQEGQSHWLDGGRQWGPSDIASSTVTGCESTETAVQTEWWGDNVSELGLEGI